MNHALWNSSVQQTDMDRAHSDGMPGLAVSQTSFPASHGSPALQSFDNPNDGSFGPGHSASPLRPRMMVQEERGLADTIYINPNSLDSNRLFSQVDEAGNRAMHAPNSSLNFNTSDQAVQATASSIPWQQFQQQSDARIERVVPGVQATTKACTSLHDEMKVTTLP